MLAALAFPFSARRPSGYTRLAVDIGLTLGGGGPNASARALQPAVGDDAALVEALARGDARALELVYERHSRGVYSLALRLLSDGPAAEEVVQETFLKLWRQPSAYQPARGRLFPWLLGVAHHHAVDVLRRRQLEQRHRIAAPTSNNRDGLTELLDNFGMASTEGDPQAGVGAIEQRLPLELAYFRGMTQLEIATLLGQPLGTIKTRMRLGLQQLRKAPDLSRLWSDR